MHHQDSVVGARVRDGRQHTIGDHREHMLCMPAMLIAITTHFAAIVSLYFLN
jgi:hypothetical protein